MAITFSSLTYQPVGHQWRVHGLVTFASGGGVVTPAAIGLSVIDRFSAEPLGGYVPQYTPSTGQLDALYGNYDDTGDSVLIADASATLANVPFEAYGV